MPEENTAPVVVATPEPKEKSTKALKAEITKLTKALDKCNDEHSEKEELLMNKLEILHRENKQLKESLARDRQVHSATLNTINNNLLGLRDTINLLALSGGN